MILVAAVKNVIFVSPEQHTEVVLDRPEQECFLTFEKLVVRSEFRRPKKTLDMNCIDKQHTSDFDFGRSRRYVIQVNGSVTERLDVDRISKMIADRYQLSYCDKNRYYAVSTKKESGVFLKKHIDGRYKTMSFKR